MKSPHDIILSLLKEGLEAADPYKAVINHVRIKNDKIIIGDRYETVLRKIHVIGFGKSSYKMALAVNDLFEKNIVGGVIITPDQEGSLGNILVLKGDHPIPRDNTLRSSKKLLEYLENIDEKDLVFILISGGGSALFEIPLKDISLEEIALVSELLMKSGADIFELNTVRKHLSAVKGGRLLKYIKSKEIYSLIISDVIGDPISFIASGPTDADPTTYRDAVEVIKRRGLWNKIPDKIKDLLMKGMEGFVEESIKPGDKILNKCRNIVIASNKMSLEAIERKAKEIGFNTLFLGPYIQGEAREVGKMFASILRSIKKINKPISPPGAVIAGGETTVTVRGRGVGGRNQETCLSLMIEIKDLDNVYFACMGSDGVDGVSPAAGAVVDDKAYWEAVEKGLDPKTYLDNNDSYTILKSIGRTIETGYTGTNVGDFYIGLLTSSPP